MPDNPFLNFNPGQSIVTQSGIDPAITSALVGLGTNIFDTIFGGDEETEAPAQTQQPAAGQPGCAITVPVQVKSRAACPPGYVVVHPPGQGKQCMLKSAARACGLWKPAAKPPIKASDWRCLRKASSVVKKMDRIAKMTNEVTGKAPLRRVRSKR
jgi:hypothetical protein